MSHDSAVASKTAFLARLAASIAFLLDGLIFATWVTRIPAIQENLAMRNSVLGLALLMISLGALLTMPLVGRLVATRGSGPVTVLAVALFGTSLLFPALASHVGTLGLSLFLFGVGFGAVNVAANAQAVTIERAYGKPIMASFHALFSLGGIIGGFLGSLAAAWQLRPTLHFTAMSIFTVVSILLIRPLLLADPPPIHTDSNPASKASGSFRLLALGAIAFCSMFGEGAMADWSAVFLRQVSLSTAATAALGFAAFSVFMTIGRTVADRLTLAIGPVRIVQLGGTLAAGGVLLAMLLPGAVTAIIGFAIVGAGLSSLVPTIFSAAGKSPGIAPSVAIATVATTGYFGFLCGPPLIGIASEFVTLRWSIGFVLVAGSIAVALARYVAVEKQDPRLPDEEVSAGLDPDGASDLNVALQSPV